VEEEIGAALRGQRWEQAATLTVRMYGPEILRLLHAIVRDKDTADEAFSVFTERLWVSLPTFGQRCSMRTWSYLLARQSAQAVSERARRIAKRERIVSEAVDNAAQQIRTETKPWLRTEARSAITALREELPSDDQMLLILRVERKLEWNDIATVLAPDDDVKRAAARMRKRFQLLTEKLRELGKQRGLLP
jgi:RNA polymerase sigma-70 factor, ECF subfamily